MSCCGWRPKERSPALAPGPLVRLVPGVVNELLGWRPKERSPSLAPGPLVIAVGRHLWKLAVFKNFCARNDGHGSLTARGQSGSRAAYFFRPCLS